MKSVKTNILQFVEKNKINMIPRWKFLLYSLLLFIGACFSFVALVFIGSLIIFVLSTYGFIYLPIFGFGELAENLRAIPILLLLLTVALIVVVEVLVRNYSFSFRKPVLTTMFTLIVLAIILSYLVTLTPVHREIRAYARDNHIDFVYHGYDRPLPLKPMKGMTVIRGIVVSTTTDSVTLKISDDSFVVVYASTTLMKKIDLPDKDDEVVIFGRVIGDKFEAVDVKHIEDLPF